MFSHASSCLVLLSLSLFLSLDPSLSFLAGCHHPPISTRAGCSLDFLYSYSPVTLFCHCPVSSQIPFHYWIFSGVRRKIIIPISAGFLYHHMFKHTPDIIIVAIKMFHCFLIIFIYFTCLIGMALGDNMIRVSYYKIG